MSDRELRGPRLPALIQSALIYHNPAPFLEACHRRYGTCFAIKLIPFGKVTYLAGPHELRAVFNAGDALYAGEMNGLLRPLFGSSSLFLLDGEEHIALRRLLSKAMKGTSQEAQGASIENLVIKDIESWPIRRPFSLHQRMQAVTLEVIIRTILGVADEARLQELRSVLQRALNINLIMLLMMMAPRLARLPIFKRYEFAVRRTRDLVLEEIRTCRKEATGGNRQDILAKLVHGTGNGHGSVPDAIICDNLLTMLIAGHETTAAGIAWTFERLLRSPEQYAAARDAALRGDDAHLDSVIKETLRVRPVVYDVLRRVKRPVDTPSISLTPGTTVLLGLGVIHHSPAYHSRPKEFRPGRFREAEQDRYAWVPFGGGLRHCLGAPFALFEMRVILRTVLTTTVLRPDRQTGEGVALKHVMLVPRRGSRVVLDTRKPQPARRRLMEHAE